MYNKILDLFDIKKEKQKIIHSSYLCLYLIMFITFKKKLFIKKV